MQNMANRITITPDMIDPLDYPHISKNTGNLTYEQYLVSDDETGMYVKYIRYPRGVVTPKHDHTCAHGMYVLSGMLVTDSGSYPPGSFVWFPEGDVMTHGASNDADCDCIFITNKSFTINYLELPQRPV